MTLFIVCHNSISRISQCFSSGPCVLSFMVTRYVFAEYFRRLEYYNNTTLFARVCGGKLKYELTCV
jgi:hypothetical protein